MLKAQMQIMISEVWSILTTFTKKVRSGTCGQGQWVRAGTVQVVVQVTVCAIGKTFELDRCPNLLYHAKGHYWLPLE
jgi:hypothetical protein